MSGLVGGEEGGRCGGAVGVEAGSVERNGLAGAIGGGESHVAVVDEGHQFEGFSGGGGHVPAAGFGVEVEAHNRAVVFVDDVVAFAVALHHVALAVVAVNALGAAGHGVVAAPEFDAVDYENVGEGRYFIDGQNPEGYEYEFVHYLVADGFVPRHEAFGQGEAADA